MTLEDLRNLAAEAAYTDFFCSVRHVDEYGNSDQCPDEVKRGKARKALIRRAPEIVRLCNDLMAADSP